MLPSTFFPGFQEDYDPTHGLVYAGIRRGGCEISLSFVLLMGWDGEEEEDHDCCATLFCNLRFDLGPPVFLFCMSLLSVSYNSQRL